MDILTAASSVTKHAGSIPDMLPKFAVIALVVALILVALAIYSRRK